MPTFEDYAATARLLDALGVAVPVVIVPIDPHVEGQILPRVAGRSARTSQPAFPAGADPLR